MERVIPDFMQKYYNGSNYEGKQAIKKLAGEYEDERRQFFETTFNEKQSFQRDWNKLTGQRKELIHEEAIRPINQKYREKVQEIAKAHGYKEQATEKAVAQKKQPVQKTPEQKAKVDQFMKNLQSIRERNKQTHRSRQ